MRTTLTIDDRIARKLKQIAHDSERPFKTVVNEVLEAGLAPKSGRKARPFRLQPASLGGVRKGVDLDKALALADSLEDDEIARKMDLRK